MWSVRELVLALRRGDLRPQRLVEECLDRINEQRDLNAFLWCDRERILGDVLKHPSDYGPLAGLPIALKDNIDTAGIPTTSGSLVDYDRKPRTDAAVWRRLRDVGGAVLVGKAHMAEFAYRSHHPELGRPRNPRRRDRAPGGSSSGSAVAVAARLVPAAIGTDTGGSVRIPASYCGIVGLKGTFGLVETAGVVPLSSTMDHVGVLAGSATDAAIVFEQMVRDPIQLVDPKTLEIPRPDPTTLKVGVAEGYLGSQAQPAVLEAWNQGVRLLEGVGCEVVAINVAAAGHWRAAHKTILLFEAWRFHASRMRANSPYGPVFREAINAGSQITTRQYEHACRTRDEAREAMASLFCTIDVLTTPTCPTVAPRGDEGVRRVSYTRYTTLAALIGVPAISIPVGRDDTGLPIGIQLLAAPYAEPKLLGVAALLEALLSSSDPAGAPRS